MKTIKVNLLEYSELGDEAKERAYLEWSRDRRQDPYLLEHTGNEIMESIRACIGAFDCRLVDWRLSEEGFGNRLSVIVPEYLEDMGARRLIKWVANNVMQPSGMHLGNYRDGHCPWTGVSFDDDCLCRVMDGILAGMGVKDALDSLDFVYSDILTKEREWLCGKQCFEECDACDMEFTEEGKRYMDNLPDSLNEAIKPLDLDNSHSDIMVRSMGKFFKVVFVADSVKSANAFCAAHEGVSIVCESVDGSLIFVAENKEAF